MGSQRNGLSFSHNQNEKYESFHALPEWDTATPVDPGDAADSPAPVPDPYLSLKVADGKLRCVMETTGEAVT